MTFMYIYFISHLVSRTSWMLLITEGLKQYLLGGSLKMSSDIFRNLQKICNYLSAIVKEIQIKK